MTLHLLNKSQNVLLSRIIPMLRLYQYQEILKLLDKSNEESTLLIEFLRRLITGIQQVDMGNWDDARELLNPLKEKAETIHFTWGLGQTLLGLTEIALHDKFYEEALKNGVEALNIFKRNSYHLSRCDALNTLGRAFFLAGDFKRSIEKYNELALIAITQQDAVGQAKALNNAGIIRMLRGDFIGSRENFKTALDALIGGEITGTINRICLCNLASANRGCGDFNTAISILTDGLSMFIKSDEKEDLANVHQSLGDVYSEIGEWEKAQKQHEKSIALLNEINDTQTFPLVLSSIGDDYARRLDFGEAINFYEKALTGMIDNDQQDEDYILIKSSYVNLLLATDDLETARKELTDLQLLLRTTRTNYGRCYVNIIYAGLLMAENSINDAIWTLYDTLINIETFDFGELIPETTLVLVENLLTRWMKTSNQSDYTTALEELENIITFSDKHLFRPFYITGLTSKAALLFTRPEMMGVAQLWLDKAITIAEKYNMKLHANRAKYIREVIDKIIEIPHCSTDLPIKNLQRIAASLSILTIKEVGMKLTKEKRANFEREIEINLKIIFKNK